MLVHQPVHRLLVLGGRNAVGVEFNAGVRAMPAVPALPARPVPRRLAPLLAWEAVGRDELAQFVAHSLPALLLRQRTEDALA